MKTSRELAIRALIKVEEDHAYSNIIANSIIKENKLSSNEISLFMNIFYGVLEKKITLDYFIRKNSKLRLKKINPYVLQILRCGAYQIIYMDKIPDSAAVNESVNLTKVYRQEQSSGFVNGVLHSIAKNRQLSVDGETLTKTLSVVYSVGEGIISLFLDQYGEKQTRSILKGFNNKKYSYIRANNIKISDEQLVNQLNGELINSKALKYPPHCIAVEGSLPVARLKTFSEGYFHVQDKSSQICALLLDAKENDLIADLCAAPGGKSFSIAENMENKGTVFCFDLYPQRVKLIQTGAKRLGLDCIKAEVSDATIDTKQKYDRVLCDVPCSGLGVLAKKPEMRYNTPPTNDEYFNTQLSIINSGAEKVKVGGTLIYSTCTINKNENEKVIDKFMADNTSFEKVNLEIDGVNILENHKTFMPGEDDCDGFFIAKFKRIK